LTAFAAVRRWDVLFVVAAACSFLSKEAFALTAPALAGLRVLAAWCGSGWRIPLSAWAVLALGVLETVTVFLIGAAAGPLSYGGRYLALPGLGGYARSMAQNAAILGFVGVASVVPVALLVGREWVRRRVWVVSTGLMALLVLPQLALYSQQGIFEGKYEAAGAMGVASWSMLCVALLGRSAERGSAGGGSSEPRGSAQAARAEGGSGTDATRAASGASRGGRAYTYVLALWAVAVALFGFSTWTYASAFSADSLELAGLVDAVSAQAPPNALVGIAADPARQYEPIVSLADHIAHRGRGDLQLRVLPLAPSQPYTPLEASFAHALAGSRFEQPPLGSADCQNLEALIALGDEAQTLAALPCLGERFTRVEFSRSLLLWGGDAVSLRPRLPGFARVGYVLYQRAR
jgi:hypothetical protein